MTSQIGLLDADVLIAAHRNYYAPDLCSGFWNCMTHHLSSGRLLIIDRVLSEIKYPPELVAWVKQASQSALVPTTAPNVVQAYATVMDWVQNNPQFTQAAKDAFARKADGWLVAYAMVNGVHVVTNEVFDPNIRRDVKIPNVCRHFRVNYQDTFEMLRDLRAHFDWSRP